VTTLQARLKKKKSLIQANSTSIYKFDFQGTIQFIC